MNFLREHVSYVSSQVEGHFWTPAVGKIDEAYALANRYREDFGHIAIQTLLTHLENDSNDLIVVIAGYPDLMTTFLDSNPGLRSRFPHHLHFPDYTTHQLVDILIHHATAHGYIPDPEFPSAARALIDRIPRGHGFGNGRVSRTIAESTIAAHAVRITAIPTIDDTTARTLTTRDLPALDTLLPPTGTRQQAGFQLSTPITPPATPSATVRPTRS